jgi:hypothetical protein
MFKDIRKIELSKKFLLRFGNSHAVVSGPFDISNLQFDCRKGTKMGFRLILTAAIGITISATSATGAFALTNVEVCTGTASNRYLCTAEWGYVGEDPYNVDRFSTIASDGSKHGCTSFAAYMVALLSPWMPAISTFDSAQYWDTDADTRTDAVLSIVPKVGDIAQWNADSGLAFGHVAYVKSVVKSPTGTVLYIVVADDNGGRLVTTQRKLYPGVTTGTISWPDKFITFPKNPPAPGGSGGGGGNVIPLLTPLGMN